MKLAVDGMDMDSESKAKLWRYLEGAALHMVNALD
jgi:hemoglobin